MRINLRSTAAVVALAVSVGTTHAATPQWTLVAWNDLGMHCVDGNDYSIFSILPPYNTIHAQLIDSNGKLVTTASNVTVTYEAIADPSGSIDRTSVGKTNFWQYVQLLLGAKLTPDAGLAGHGMPARTTFPRR